MRGAGRVWGGERRAALRTPGATDLSGARALAAVSYRLQRDGGGLRHDHARDSAPEVTLDPALMARARLPIERMLLVG